MRALLIILLVCCFSLFEVSAQGFFMGGLGKFTKRKRYWSTGVSVNTIHYFGDLVPKNRIGSFDLDFTKPNYGIFVQRRWMPRMSTRLSFAYGNIAGEDHTSSDPDDIEFGGAFRYKRNLHFRNSIYNISLTAVIDAFPNKGLSNRRPDHPIPYGIIGVGVLYHNPQAMTPDGFDGPEWIDLRPLRTENQEREYSSFALTIPMGIGIRYRISDQLDVALEMTYRHTFTDYLDDVSGDYVDLGEFDSDLRRALHDRSAEPVAMFSGESRSPETVTYPSAVDGRQYEVVNGYGMPNNRRGAPDKDIIVVTGLHFSYIFKTY